MSDIQAITYLDGVAVTKSDTTNDPAGPFAGFLVTVTGNVSFVTMGGNTIALTSVAANVVIPIACRRINSTNTSATVVGLYANPYRVVINPGAGTVL